MSIDPRSRITLNNLSTQHLGSAVSAKLLTALWCAVTVSNAAVLPDGTGKAETVRLCGKCHSLDQAVSLRQGQPGWAETIAKMVNLGAQGSDDDLNTILNYLVKFYGPATGAPGSPASAGSRSANIAGSVAGPSSSIETVARPAGSTNAKAVSLPVVTHNVDPAKEWRTYGHDAGAMRFSPLKQIRP